MKKLAATKKLKIPKLILRKATSPDEINEMIMENVETINHPAHYGGDTLYETIKVMAERLTREEFIGAMKFNVYKYNDRAKQKGVELENYRKAQFYQNYLVMFMDATA